ncbi:hypothetical protein ANBU17_23520 [Anaerostipes butyraticus]|uniref:Uncharacterized protein n=1 Tax=Anaerostipes butyraticus TaxID=645466 RepID=A0A916VDN8_9FIRM|nr:hypothetical protein ANBU17_23520 [Anaerostipes butyraticus]
MKVREKKRQKQTFFSISTCQYKTNIAILREDKNGVVKKENCHEHKWFVEEKKDMGHSRLRLFLYGGLCFSGE